MLQAAQDVTARETMLAEARRWERVATAHEQRAARLRGARAALPEVRRLLDHLTTEVAAGPRADAIRGDIGGLVAALTRVRRALDDGRTGEVRRARFAHEQARRLRRKAWNL